MASYEEHRGRCDESVEVRQRRGEVLRCAALTEELAVLGRGCACIARCARVCRREARPDKCRQAGCVNRGAPPEHEAIHPTVDGDSQQRTGSEPLAHRVQVSMPL